jgi:RNA polymerase sigma-70 factor (family 1)
MNESTTQLSDDALVQSFKNGSNKAFTEIYNRYWKKLFTAAANKLDNHEEAEDIVQQIFVSIWFRREELDIHAQLYSYLAVAVRYRVYKVLIARSRQRYCGDDAAESILLNIPDDSTRQWLQFDETNSRVNNLVALLPEKCRLIFEMSRVEGYSHKQIASELKLSEKTVEWYIGKAIKAIKRGLKVLLIGI